MHLQVFVGHLPDPFGDRPAVLGFERERGEDQQVERALHQVSRFAHGDLDHRHYTVGVSIVKASGGDGNDMTRYVENALSPDGALAAIFERRVSLRRQKFCEPNANDVWIQRAS